jgi:serine protease Do
MSEENNYYDQNDKFEDQENNQNNKKKNKGPMAILIAAIAIVVILCCVLAIYIVANKNKGYSTKIPSTVTEQATEYSDIGSTGSTESNSTGSGSVVVTDVSSVVDNVMPSVVAITSKTVMESNGYGSIYDFYFGGGSENSGEYEQEAAGSGIIVNQTDSELLIVTNNHVVEDADSLKIQFDGMDEDDAVDGYIKGTDSDADVAVVAVKLKDIPSKVLSTIKKATLGDSDDVSVGEGVIAIGNALGYGQSVTTGVISAKDRTVTIEDKEMTLLQTDAAINGGNSGGALINSKGEVIGINVAKYSSSGSSTSASIEGMGFAIPISSVKNIISNLETKETREKVDEDKQGYLGITSKYDVTDEISEAYSMPTGVFINDIVKGGPADKAGIQSGDIITKFDGQQISTMEELQKVMQYYKSGEKVTVTISYVDGREYKEKNVKVTLGDKSVISESQTSASKSNN